MTSNCRLASGGLVTRTSDPSTRSRPADSNGVMHPHGLHRLLHPVWFRPVHTALVRAVALEPDEQVLDVGAGTGVLSLRLAATGANVICLEPDAASLGAAKRRLVDYDAQFLKANVEQIPLPSASVDAAVASVTAHHWANQSAGFAELARVVRPGGRLVIAEFRPGGPVLRRLRRLAGSKHADPPDLATWTARLQSAGFTNVKTEEVGPAKAVALILSGIRNGGPVPSVSVEPSTTIP
jgi:SAM-dependent methyltransferase